MIVVRAAEEADFAEIRRIFQPVVTQGDSYPCSSIAWSAPSHPLSSSGSNSYSKTAGRCPRRFSKPSGKQETRPLSERPGFPLQGFHRIVQAIHPGQPDVEEHQVGRGGTRMREPSRGVPGGAHLVAGVLHTIVPLQPQCCIVQIIFWT